MLRKQGWDCIRLQYMSYAPSVCQTKSRRKLRAQFKAVGFKMVAAKHTVFWRCCQVSSGFSHCFWPLFSQVFVPWETKQRLAILVCVAAENCNALPASSLSLDSSRLLHVQSLDKFFSWKLQSIPGDTCKNAIKSARKKHRSRDTILSVYK